MMHGFYVILSAETASFRDPGGQLYQATLPLPPVSTIIGIAGAAMGLNFQEIWEFFKAHDIRVGTRSIRGRESGKGLDLWKYQKIVSKEVRSDILKREFLFHPTYILFYGCHNREALVLLHKAFLDPAWALSLGTSDDIALIKKVSNIEEILETNGVNVDYKDSLIPGDQTNNYSFDWEEVSRSPVRTLLELPTVKQLPVDFSFTGNGERKGSLYQPFTFLSGSHCLKSPCPTYIFDEHAVALISVTQR
jgi:CRISPR-associated protein Cas5t